VSEQIEIAAPVLHRQDGSPVPRKSINRLSENRIVDLVKRRFAGQSPLLEQGIGDDAAVIRPPGAKERWVITTDMLLEDVDFRRGWQTAAELGWKSLAVNLSDLAAMGVKPRFYTVSLALPRGIQEPWIVSFYTGVRSVGNLNGALLIGGDLSGSPKGIHISITAIGETRRRKIVYRTGGRPGDRVYVTGILGRAAAGLLLLKNGIRRGRTLAERRALAAHRKPQPRCVAGEWLAQNGFARAMMDLSDGLSTDLPRLCRASGTGACVCASQLPREAGDGLGFDPLELALHGGEDFELVFCVAPREARALESAWPSGFPPIHCIGNLEAGAEVVVLQQPGKKPLPLGERGYDHFRAILHSPVAHPRA
jgi:thiamine-monophosphate kinase